VGESIQERKEREERDGELDVGKRESMIKKLRELYKEREIDTHRIQ